MADIITTTELTCKQINLHDNWKKQLWARWKLQKWDHELDCFVKLLFPSSRMNLMFEVDTDIDICEITKIRLKDKAIKLCFAR